MTVKMSIVLVGIFALGASGGYFLGTSNGKSSKFRGGATSEMADPGNSRGTLISRGTKSSLSGDGQSLAERFAAFDLNTESMPAIDALIAQMKQPNGNGIESLFEIWEVLRNLDEAGILSIVEQLRTMNSGPFVDQIRGLVFTRFGAINPQAAIASALQEKNPDVRRGLVQQAMMAWLGADPEVAFQWLQENEATLSANESIQLNVSEFESQYYANLAAGDLDNVLAKWENLSEDNRAVVAASVGRRAGNDPTIGEKLLAHLKEQGPGALELESLYYLSLAQSSFSEVLTKLGEMSESTREEIVSSLATDWGLDPARREELMTQLRANHPEQIGTAVRAIIDNMSSQTPQQALEFIAEQNLESDLQQELVSQASGIWAESDPGGYLGWTIENGIGGDLEQQDFARIFGNWANQDEGAAAQWLVNQDPKYRTDEVYENVSRSLRLNNRYARAAEWSSQIFSEQERHRNIHELYRMWRNDDQRTADAWKEQLPQEDQNFLDRNAADFRLEGEKSKNATKSKPRKT